MDEDDAPPGVPEWVVTYGDMMSLLLTFFIMLVSMSEITEERRYREVLESLHRRLGYTTAASAPPGELPAGNAGDSARAVAGVPAVEAPGEGGTPRPASPGPRPALTREPAGRPVSAGPAVLFEAGSALLAAGAGGVLDELAAAIAGKPQTVELRGFAAAGPGSDRLAHRRTRAVLGELTARGVRPGRFRLRTGGPATRPGAAPGGPPPPADRVEVWALDRLAPAPRAGR